MTFDELLDERIRQILREELKARESTTRLFTPEQLAERWSIDKQAVHRLAKSNQLKAVKLSERNIRFTYEEVRRFEESGGEETGATAD